MQIRIVRFDIHRINLRTRMPFRYGIATMTEVPEVFVRLWVKLTAKSGRASRPIACRRNGLPKYPANHSPQKLTKCCASSKKRCRCPLICEEAVPFDMWRQLYEAQGTWAQREQIPPLLAHFGTSLVERALLEALCEPRHDFREDAAGELAGNKSGNNLPAPERLQPARFSAERTASNHRGAAYGRPGRSAHG